MKRKSVYEKHLLVLIKILIGIYFFTSFILLINENFEAIYLNLIGLLMLATPIGVNYARK